VYDKAGSTLNCNAKLTIGEEVLHNLIIEDAHNESTGKTMEGSTYTKYVVLHISLNNSSSATLSEKTFNEKQVFRERNQINQNEYLEAVYSFKITCLLHLIPPHNSSAKITSDSPHSS
jgi:hypothetical protein